MMGVPKCDRCERPAVYHETSLVDGKPTERHWCRRHGHRLWFDSCRQLLVDAVDHLPAELLPDGVEMGEVKAQLAQANTLSQARSVLGPGRRDPR